MNGFLIVESLNTWKFCSELYPILLLNSLIGIIHLFQGSPACLKGDDFLFQSINRTLIGKYILVR